MVMRPIIGFFCLNQFGVGPVHISWSLFKFRTEFVEIFVISPLSIIRVDTYSAYVLREEQLYLDHIAG